MAEEIKDLDIERSDIVIENNVATWTFKAEGPIHGTYMGTFKFKCYLDPSEILAAGRERRDLLGQNAILANKDEAFLAYALPQLRYRVISGPPFFEDLRKQGKYGADLPDLDVMSVILDAALAAELKFKKEIEKRKKDAIERAKKAAEQILEQQKADNKDDGTPQESGD